MPNNPFFRNVPVLIKGAGDLASGVAYRLKRAGLPVLMTELRQPLFVRRTVCYGEAVYQGEVTVEGIRARRAAAPDEAAALLQTEANDIIPILVDPEAAIIARLRPKVIVDAIMAKTNTGTRLDDAPLVIALGPGFTAGRDCHAVIETNRGHWLGRVIYNGRPQPDTKTPGVVKGYATDRVLRAPAAGHVTGAAEIGQQVSRGQRIATVGAKEVCAPFDGVLRGLIHPSVMVSPGMKIGDLDPRGIVEHCFSISDKSLAIGGGVLEAILASQLVRPPLT